MGAIPFERDMQMGYRIEFISTVPKSSAATEKLIFYSALRGAGSSYIVSPEILGKTLIVADSTATVATNLTKTFTRADFLNPNKPTMAEVAAAFDLALTNTDDTDITVGSNGELVITGATTGTTQTLTLGAGTANRLLGFPSDGVTVLLDNNAHTITVTLPSTFYGIGAGNEWLYTRNPSVRVANYAPTTGILSSNTAYTTTWTPSARTLVITDSGNAARAAHVSISL